MNYWLDLFTPHTWERFQENGSDTSGFRPRQRRAAFERVKKGDLFLCYLVKISRWSGVLEVVSDAYEDSKPIFADPDPFTIRFQVKPLIVLDFEHSVPIEIPELWNRLSFTRELKPGSFGWAQSAKMRQSLFGISRSDGDIIQSALAVQKTNLLAYPLDAADQRHVRNRDIVRTEHGEIEVVVPEREEASGAAEEPVPEVRASLAVQASLAKLGAILGFTVWIPPGDRGKVLELLPKSFHEKVATSLPLNYDNTTLKTIENIDVIWLERRSIARAFEVEHTTPIFSGLLRMADLLTMQPRIDIQLHIVAPEERRDQVRREILRPVFSVMEGGALSQKCSFVSYDALEQLLALKGLSHMNESILEEYEEFFDEA